MFGFMKKSTVYTVDQLARVAGWIGWASSSGGAVSEYSAVDVTAVFCGARVIAEGLAQMPVRVIREEFDANGVPKITIQRDHWAHSLISKKPNSWQTSYEFREGMVFNAVLGAGAIAIKNVVRGEVRELLPIPAGSWSVEQLPDYSLRIRIDYADKTHGYFDLSQVFYLRGPSLDGFQALPAVRQAREAIGLSRALERQQSKLAGNGGKPSGVLSFAQRLAPETATKLRETWQERFGINGDGGIAVLDGDAKFHSMTMTSVDAQHLETRRMQVEEIARALRVQPVMLMQAGNTMTFASAKEMLRYHVIHSLGPWIERFEQALTRDILGDDESLRIDLDERNLMRGDFKEQSEYFARALGSGGHQPWMTLNEVRAEIGVSPIEEKWANTLPQVAVTQGAGNGNQISE